METLEKLTLNKHIATIHCSNNISLLQRKIYNVLLYRAYDRLLEDDFHSISLSDLSKITGYNSKDTEKLKKAFRGLQETIVEWNILENAKNGEGDQNDLIWCSSSLLASTEINSKTKMCVYEFSRKLAELLYQPDIYARIDLSIQTKFNSNYALALYENCLRFRRIKTTGWISYVDFRKLMGVSKSKSKTSSDFNPRVLSVAVNEVNEFSDIKIEAQIKRVSQKVIAIKFDIEPAAKDTHKILPAVKSPPDAVIQQQDDLINKLCDIFKSSRASAIKLLKQYGLEYIEEKIKIVINMPTYKNGLVKSPIALLKSALAEDYKNAGTGSNGPATIKKLFKPSSQQQNDYNNYLAEETLEIINNLPKEERKQLIAEFELYAKQFSETNPSWSILLSLYKSRGLPAVRQEFYEFIKRKFPTIIIGLPEIEQFLVNFEAV